MPIPGLSDARRLWYQPGPPAQDFPGPPFSFLALFLSCPFGVLTLTFLALTGPGALIGGGAACFAGAGGGVFFAGGGGAVFFTGGVVFFADAGGPGAAALGRAVGVASLVALGGCDVIFATVGLPVLCSPVWWALWSGADELMLVPRLRPAELGAADAAAVGEAETAMATAVTPAALAAPVVVAPTHVADTTPLVPTHCRNGHVDEERQRPDRPEQPGQRDPRNARTMAGSKCVPAQRVSSARAENVDRAALYDRAAVIVSNASTTATARPAVEMALAARPARVSRAVVPLVVLGDPGEPRAQPLLRAGRQRGAGLGVPPDQLPLGARSACRAC